MTDNDEGLQRVVGRNAFYRRQFHFILGFCLLVLILDLILTGIVRYQVQHPMQPFYFPADLAGRLIQEVPPEKPNMSQQAVSDWVVQAVETTYSYDFMNYRGQLQTAQKYFTPVEWQNYMKALERSRNMVALTQRKLIGTAKVTGVPKLVKMGLTSDGRFAWRFEMPVLMHYLAPPFNAQSGYYNPLVVTVAVQRQSVLEGDEGLGIIQLNAFTAS